MSASILVIKVRKLFRSFSTSYRGEQRVQRTLQLGVRKGRCHRDTNHGRQKATDMTGRGWRRTWRTWSTCLFRLTIASLIFVCFKFSLRTCVAIFPCVHS